MVEVVLPANYCSADFLTPGATKGEVMLPLIAAARFTALPDRALGSSNSAQKQNSCRASTFVKVVWGLIAAGPGRSGPEKVMRVRREGWGWILSYWSKAGLGQA